MNLNQKKVIIIGGSSGIGFAVAQKASKQGAELHLIGRDSNKLQESSKILKDSGGNVTTYQLDATDPAAIEDFFIQVNGFDHLVSMVGGFMQGGFLTPPLETIREAVEMKFFANLLIARLAHLKVSGQGSLIFTAGSGGRPQDASGAIIGNQAIRTMVEGLAAELAPKVRVNGVAPTWTDTPLWRGFVRQDVEQTKAFMAGIIPLKRTATVEEVASAYIFLMENDFITGQTISVDGGISL